MRRASRIGCRSAGHVVDNRSRGADVPPRLAVSACVFDRDRLLLIKRAKPPFAGAWSLPGGSIEPGETAEAAILREIAEETGLQIVVLGIAGVNDVIVRDAAGALTHHYMITVFSAVPSVPGTAPAAASDAAEAAYFSLKAPEVVSLGRRLAAIIARASPLIAGHRSGQ